MLVIGSQAARMRGCLPEWRQGSSDDLDLVGTKEELQTFKTLMEERFSCVIHSECEPGRHFLSMQSTLTDRVKVEFDTRGLASASLMEVLPDNESVSIAGMPAKAISAATQYLIKRAYRRFPIWREKNDRDIAFWRSMNLSMTPAHIELFRVMWDEFDRAYQQ